jgi:hypothetical protein
MGRLQEVLLAYRKIRKRPQNGLKCIKKKQKNHYNKNLSVNSILKCIIKECLKMGHPDPDRDLITEVP